VSLLYGGWFLVLTSVAAFWPPWNMKLSIMPSHLGTKVNALQILTALYLLPILFGQITGATAQKLLQGIGVILCFDAVALYWGAQYGIRRGFLEASTFDAGAMIIVFMLLLPRRDVVSNWLKLALLASAIVTGGETMKAMCVAFVIAYGAKLIMKIGRVREQVCYFVLVGVCLIVLFYAAPIMFDDSGRFEIWLTYLPRVFDSWIVALFGNGAGSFEWFGASHKVGGAHLLILHNEFVQILFEYGLIAFGLFVGFVVFILKRLWAYPSDFAAGVAYVLYMFVYYPMHFIITLLPGCILVCMAFQNRDETH